MSASRENVPSFANDPYETYDLELFDEELRRLDLSPHLDPEEVEYAEEAARMAPSSPAAASRAASVQPGGEAAAADAGSEDAAEGASDEEGKEGETQREQKRKQKKKEQEMLTLSSGEETFVEPEIQSILPDWAEHMSGEAEAVVQFDIDALEDSDSPDSSPRDTTLSDGFLSSQSVEYVPPMEEPSDTGTERSVVNGRRSWRLRSPQSRNAAVDVNHPGRRSKSMVFRKKHVQRDPRSPEQQSAQSAPESATNSHESSQRASPVARQHASLPGEDRGLERQVEDVQANGLHAVEEEQAMDIAALASPAVALDAALEERKDLPAPEVGKLRAEFLLQVDSIAPSGKFAGALKSIRRSYSLQQWRPVTVTYQGDHLSITRKGKSSSTKSDVQLEESLLVSSILSSQRCATHVRCMSLGTQTCFYHLTSETAEVCDDWLHYMSVIRSSEHATQQTTSLPPASGAHKTATRAVSPARMRNSPLLRRKGSRSSLRNSLRSSGSSQSGSSALPTLLRRISRAPKMLVDSLSNTSSLASVPSVSGPIERVGPLSAWRTTLTLRDIEWDKMRCVHCEKELEQVGAECPACGKELLRVPLYVQPGPDLQCEVGQPVSKDLDARALVAELDNWLEVRYAQANPPLIRLDYPAVVDALLTLESDMSAISHPQLYSDATDEREVHRGWAAIVNHRTHLFSSYKRSGWAVDFAQSLVYYFGQLTPPLVTMEVAEKLSKIFYTDGTKTALDMTVRQVEAAIACLPPTAQHTLADLTTHLLCVAEEKKNAMDSADLAQLFSSALGTSFHQDALVGPLAWIIRHRSDLFRSLPPLSDAPPPQHAVFEQLEDSERNLYFFRDVFVRPEAMHYAVMREGSMVATTSVLRDFEQPEKLRALVYSPARGFERVLLHLSNDCDLLQALERYAPLPPHDSFTDLDAQAYMRDMTRFEANVIVTKYKAGVLYRGPEDESEADMYNRELASSAYEDFLSLIAERKALDQHSGYAGGLKSLSSLTCNTVWHTTFAVTRAGAYLDLEASEFDGQERGSGDEQENDALSGRSTNANFEKSASESKKHNENENDNNEVVVPRAKAGEGEAADKSVENKKGGAAADDEMMMTMNTEEEDLHRSDSNVLLRSASSTQLRRLSDGSALQHIQLVFLDIFSLPYSLKDRQQVTRKRFVGSSSVVIIFNENFAAPFDASMMKARANCVFIVVTPEEYDDDSRVASYIVQVVSRSRVPPFRPLVPAKALSRDELRRWLHLKVANGNRAAAYTEDVHNKALKIRAGWFAKLAQQLKSDA